MSENLAQCHELGQYGVKGRNFLHIQVSFVDPLFFASDAGKITLRMDRGEVLTAVPFNPAYTFSSALAIFPGEAGIVEIDDISIKLEETSPEGKNYQLLFQEDFEDYGVPFNLENGSWQFPAGKSLVASPYSDNPGFAVSLSTVSNGNALRIYLMEGGIGRE